jgi:ribosome-associated toxin RatA of RatAB toxin-antitoxin module
MEVVMAFENVATEAALPGFIRKENAWNIICDYSRYPSIMDNVDKVEIMERSSDNGISRWYVSVEDAPLYWVEKDFYNMRDFEIVFNSIEGDFDNINGRWRIKDNLDSGINIRFEIQYNLGIPVIEEVLGTVLHDKMKTNIDKMLAAVSKELSATGHEERRYTRRAIGRIIACSYDNKPIRPFILNISAGGMMTRLVPGISKGATLDLASTLIDVEEVLSDERANQCRFIFRNPLDTAQLQPLCTRLAAGSGRLSRPAASAPQEALIFCDDRELPIQILDITSSGMSIAYPEAALPQMEVFTIGNTAISLKGTVHDRERNLLSVSFSDPLNDEQVKWVRDHFRLAAKK